MIDFLLIAIVAGVAWCVASEGAWGAAVTALAVIISGLLAMGMFESVAQFLQNKLAYSWQYHWDFIALVGLFAGGVFLIRAGTEKIMPVDLEVQGTVFDVVRWGCGVLAGYVTMAFLLTALHTAPLPREFLGFTPEPERRTGPLGSLAPDFQWLGFTHYVTKRAFNTGGDGPIWDGARFAVVPNAMGEPGHEKIWPSFPIRYASRRAQYYGAAPPATGTGQSGAGGGAPTQTRPSGGRPSGGF